MAPRKASHSFVSFILRVQNFIKTFRLRKGSQSFCVLHVLILQADIVDLIRNQALKAREFVVALLLIA